MSYDAENAEEIPTLKPGIVQDGVIISLKDGVVRDHIREESRESWKGNLDQTAIKIVVECLHNNEKWQDEKILTYHFHEGVTKFRPTSSMGKFKAYYEIAPKIGQKVQMKTNAEGYFRIVIE